MPHLYDTTSGRLRTAFSIAHTVLPNVLASPEFWMFFLFHLATFFSYRLGLIEVSSIHDDDMALHWRSVRVVTAMTTFFEVFYSNQCYSRYLSLHQSTRGIFDDAHAFAQLIRTHVGAKSQCHARLSIRYMMAALSLQVAEMRDGVKEGQLEDVCAMALLHSPEAEELLRQKPKHRASIIINWSQQVACKGCARVEAPNNIQSVLCQTLLKMQARQQDIVDTLALPVPFQYFHLLSVMIIMNLALWAYSMGCSDSIFAPIVYFFASLIFIGMMELSSELSDPFGNDEVDFPLGLWLTECLDLVSSLVEHRYPGGPEGLDLAVEMELPLPDSKYEGQARTLSEIAHAVTQQRSEGDTSDRSHYALLHKEGGRPAKKLPQVPREKTLSAFRSDARVLLGFETGGP